MKKLLPLLFLIGACITTALHAQTDEYWNFRKAAIVFKTGQGIMDTTNNNCITHTIGDCHTSVCDNSGNLLFYSNGYSVYDKNNNIMTNGNHFNHSTYGDVYINGNSAYPVFKGAIILPFVNDTNKYYMFYEDMGYQETGATNFLPSKLRFLVIDKRLNGGLGDIIFKDSTILSGDTLKDGNIFAIKHGNGTDWWVIVREFRTNKFYKILITANGIQTPTTQNIGTAYRTSSFYNGEGDVSSDGSQLIYFNTTFNFTFGVSSSQMDILDFDRCTGVLSNVKNITVPSVVGSDSLAWWSTCLSPNKRFVYATDGSYMWQMDLNSSNILNSRIKVGTWDGTTVLGNQTWFFQMKNGIDNKTYVSCYGGNSYIHVINQPDSLGIACDFVQKQLYVGSVYTGHFQRGSFPNTPNYKLGAINCNVGMENKLTDSNKGLNVYPNPASTEITINKGQLAIKTIEVTNVLGQTVFIQQINHSIIQPIQLDVSHLAPQIYLLKITDENGCQQTIKFVKE